MAEPRLTLPIRGRAEVKDGWVYQWEPASLVFPDATPTTAAPAFLPMIAAPAFARLHEYAGLWAMEPSAFRLGWQSFARMDLAAHIKSATPPPQPSGFELVKGKGGKSVAVVKVMGTLMKQRSSMGGTSTIDLRRQVRMAAADPGIYGILLAIDSPGGSVAGIDDLAKDVKAARRKKPVHAHIDDLGASAAYWIASQAEVIYANSPTALVGSIGSLLTIYDVSQAAERDGIKALVFATGPLKASGAPGTPVTDEQQAYFQSLVDATQEHFDAAVRSGRGMSAAQLKDVRSGAVFPAAVAQERKLIDGIRGLESTLEALAAAH